MKLKLMTYNIWGGQSYAENISGKPAELCKRDVAPVAEVIRQTGADIVSLNEIFNCDKYGNQTKKIANLAGFKYYRFAPALARLDLGGYYGNALLSKYPIVSLAEKKIPAETGVRLSEERSVMCATIDLSEKHIDVIVGHFGLVDAEKERATGAVLDFASISDNECVFMGDMNSNRDSDHVKRLQKVFRITNEEEIITWPTEYVPPEKQTFSSPLWNRQIDYIFVSNGIKVNKTEAVYSLASDHRALCAEVEI